MKKLIFAGLLILTGTALFAQDDHRDRDNNRDRDNRNNTQNQRYQNQPPQTVQQNWQRDHQGVSNPTWEQRNGQWHARYQDQRSNKYADSYYDRRGRYLDTHTQWDRNQLPRDFDRRIRSRYHARDYQVTRIERANNQGSLFQIILNLGNNRRTIYTDEHGNEVRYRDRH
jgi:hypothetical protein